jgi:succinoglycan biosynthesis transport protein ExoP
MTNDQLPAGPGNEGDRLPVSPEPRLHHELSPQFNAGPLSLDLLDDRRDVDPDRIDLLAYWRVIIKRRRLIAGVLAACVAVALIITLMTQPLYRATALMQVEKEGPPIVATQGAAPVSEFADPVFLNTQYQLLQSRALAERVANEMNLSAETLSSLNNAGWLGRVVSLVRPASKTGATNDATGPKRPEASLKEATGIIQRGLTVEPVRDSRLVNLSFDSPDPNFSARVVNSVAEGFIASTLERRMGTTSYAKTYLEDQLAQTKGKLEGSERKLVEFAQKEGLVSTGEAGTSLATQNLTDLNGALAEAQKQRIRAEARWRQAAGGGAMPSDMLSASGLSALQAQRGALQSQYQLKLQTFKPDYPEMQQLKSQIDEINRQINSEMGQIRASVQAEYTAAMTQETMLKGKIGALRGEALDVDSRSIEYNILKREADTNRQMYDSMLQRYKEVGAASDVRTNNITIVDRAEGGIRFKPNLLVNLGFGFLGGLLLGILLAVILEFLDDSLKSPEDIEQKLRLAVLGVIPKLGPKESMAVASSDPRSSFSEAYRSVRTALQFATEHGVPRSLLITSPSPGEGKSTSALALARNLAQLGKRVLLVDADLRNPSLHKLLGLNAELGLSNLLSGASTLGTVVQHTTEERLDVILAGPLPPNPAELLSGSKFISMLTVAAERYDQIIIDGPPVLGLADAPLLANCLESTLLVITSAKTRTSTAQIALKRLVAARARVIGALLTKYDAKAAGFGYGYQYKYDQYYAYGDRPKLTRG